MPESTYAGLSQPGQPLDQSMERILAAIADYPRGPRTKERRYRILYGLNDFAAALSACAAVRERPHLTPSRGGEIVAHPVIDFAIDGHEGEVADEIGVLYQFATDGTSVRLGMSYYPDEERQPVATIRARETEWRSRLATPLQSLAGAGFQLATDDDSLPAGQRWGFGWLAWRRYERGHVPGVLQLIDELRLVLESYDAALALDGARKNPG